MKLSIIIPIYNTSECLHRCLDSIVIQDLSKDMYEIIAVNDGSTDDSLNILQEYAKKHKHIKIINKTNGGVSSARNRGIEEAIGDYLIFIDADDSIRTGSLSAIYNHCQIYESEIIVTTSFLSEYKENYSWRNLFQDHSIIRCIDAVNKGYIRGSVCGCIIKKSLIVNNRIEFPIGILNGEDTIFMFLCMYYAGNMNFVYIPFYNVLGRTNSASRVYSVERVKKSISTIETAYILTNYNNKENESYPLLEHLKYTLLSNIIWDCIQTQGTNYFTLRSLGLKRFCRINTEGLTFQKKKIKILKLSLALFYFLFWFKHKILR